MKVFFIETQCINDIYIIHEESCGHLPKDNLLKLGEFKNFESAMHMAHKIFKCINACPHCCSENTIESCYCSPTRKFGHRTRITHTHAKI